MLTELLKSDLELQIQGETWIISKFDVEIFTQVLHQVDIRK